MEFSVLSKDIKDSRYIFVKCKYGICRIKKQHFNSGHMPTIMSALDKTDFFWNKVKDLNPYVYNNFILLDEYVSDSVKITLQLNELIFKMKPSKIISGVRPGFKSCIDKTKYFINKAKQVHGNKYDYSLVEYKNSKTKVKIICKEHGIFEQDPNNHLNGKGCNECGKLKTKEYVINNNKSSLSLKYWSKSNGTPKIYLLRCWNEEEEFYKVGKTHQNIKNRFDSRKLMPYNYEVVDILRSDANTISNIEEKFKSYCDYRPKIKFPGYTECISKIPSKISVDFEDVFLLLQNFSIEDIIFKNFNSSIIGNYTVSREIDFFIINFIKFNIFIRIDFYKNSYSNYDFYNGYGYQVTPKKKTITVFE